MNFSELIAYGTEICDRIAGMDSIKPFEWFNVDMTESMVIRENDNGRLEMVPAMVKMPGQKASERMLWHIGPVAKEREGELAAIERQASVERLAASYANDPNFELEVDVYDLALGLTNAFRHHTGENPTFLLDENGEF
jgi:hypothetical protein